jgi:hypothetical protein
MKKLIMLALIVGLVVIAIKVLSADHDHSM